MPADDETRYGDTAPPTLKQLRAMLESLASVKAFRSKAGTRTRIIFEIDAAKVAEKGGSCYATGEQIASIMLDTVSRMMYFDDVTRDYANSDRSGTTTADISAFIHNELKHVPYTNDLTSTMRRRMYGEVLQKLTELGIWRAAIDAKRFQEAQAKERKRQDEWREATRKAQEERSKAEQEEDEDKEDLYTFNDFTSAFYGGGDYHKMWEEAFNASMGKKHQQQPNYGFDSSRSGEGKQKEEPKKEEPKRPKARHKGRAPWYEVLDVAPSATAEEIKRAWRVLASKLHPDKPENRNPENLERLKEVNTAKDEGLRGL